jgi:hypothetical protein
VRDDDILRRIELWATGATIHDVRSLMGHYRVCIYILDRPEAYQKNGDYGAKCDLARATITVLAKTMEEFMSHGDYRKARRDNPLPGEETRADFPWVRVQVREHRFNYALARMPTQRERVATRDGRVFNLGVQQTCLIARGSLARKLCDLVELHYARWGKLPGWSRRLFDGMGGDEMYDDWYQQQERV